MSPRTGMRKLTPSISTSGRNGTTTSFEREPNLDSISAMKALRTEACSSSMGILKPRLSDWMTAPLRMRRKLPKASFTSKTRENTSASVSAVVVMMDLE